MIWSVSFVTHAAIRSQSVDAASVAAQVRNRVTLVDI